MVEPPRPQAKLAWHLLRSEADGRVLSFGVGVILVVVASGGIAALSPLALKALVDALAMPGQPLGMARWSTALPGAICYLLLLLLGRLLADLRPLLSGVITQRMHSRLVRRFFDHVLRLPMGYLLGRRSGELQHNLDLAGAGTQLTINHLTGSLIPVLVELATMGAVLLHLGQPALVMVFSTAALAYLAIFSSAARRVTAAARKVSTASLELYASLGDGLANIETLRCFAAEGQTSRRLRQASTSLETQWRRLDCLNAWMGLGATGVFAVSMTACILIGLDALTKGSLTVGGFVLTTVYALQMVRPLESLGAAARDLSRALGYLQPLLQLLAEPTSEEATNSDAIPDRTARKRASEVRFENLHFGYDPERPVLKGIDLHVPAGSTTAIVGASGSGKSSLARLLMRLYLPQQGRILLDGRTISSIPAAELRKALVGLVPQETTLLHDSIAGNIALGSPLATTADIDAAARGAQLEELVATLPRGLDTTVGERGMHLSGGERQRVGIARALLRGPGLYVLDEPTSMLDSATEHKIQETMRAMAADSTVIVIAHRLSTIADADEIVVLHEGRIGERGSHHELLAMNGLYAKMWHQQTSRGAADRSSHFEANAVRPAERPARPALNATQRL